MINRACRYPSIDVPAGASIAGLAALLALLAVVAVSGPARGETLAFRQALAEGASGDTALSAFYRARSHAPIWTGAQDAERRRAFVTALAKAGDHGLARPRYDVTDLIAAFEAVRSERDRGLLEARMSRAFLAYARDVHSGVLEPGDVDPGLVRTIRHRPDPARLLADFAVTEPGPFLRALPPQTAEYARLMREKRRLAGIAAAGRWGPEVRASRLEPGDSGPQVVELRNRLIAMGYLPRRAVQDYDSAVRAAVLAFQADHGLLPDGIAGPSTIRALNVGPEVRLRSVVVAMERERWMNFDRGDRHIWVNLTDFSAQIVDDGKVTFQTRSVIGKNTGDRRSPEFSDRMNHMVINPTWFVPRSIAIRDYLPRLRENPNSASHMEIVDSRGRHVDRVNTDFSQFSTRSFPFSMRQRPGPRNALGKVKFMFPNKWNIYLHDTPDKALFSREVRDYSSGCVRLNDPFDFAFELLSRQEADPEGFFRSILNTGRETRVDIENPVDIHLVYRTAFVPARGNANFRADVYGRDGRIFDALQGAGVALGEGRS